MVEQLNGGVFANSGRNCYTNTYMCSGFDEADPDLYGGGRHGDDTRQLCVGAKKDADFLKKHIRLLLLLHKGKSLR